VVYLLDDHDPNGGLSFDDASSQESKIYFAIVERLGPEVISLALPGQQVEDLDRSQVDCNYCQEDIAELCHS